MKKLMTALAALLLALTLCFTACAEPAQSEIWQLTEITANGVTFSARLANLVATLVLNPDGTCSLFSAKAISRSTLDVTDGVISLPDDQTTVVGVWVDSDAGVILTLAEDTLLFAHVGTRLQFESDGDLYFFDLDSTVPYEPGLVPEATSTVIAADEPAASEPAEDSSLGLADVPLSEFIGGWQFTYAEVGEQCLTPDDLGESYLIALTEEGGLIQITNAESSAVHALEYEMMELDGFGTVLYACIPDPENSGLYTDILPLMLRADGTLLWLGSSEGQDVFYRFIRIE